ncbi:homocysteine S-methyltransferase family protein [Roseburia sp. MSJ-14]|uniref:homocysteine S-methyltransferase family protein n=1 Tax=Roseburia sp. MSJ-14 TaxID=2841514 RepID=UPI001C122B20|nr:homocysteine S-methyltransferase family protein [Roseburia sp. MSJ-14]MBU5472553.1 homocysteine S-methyltransferase family protein [Roseburia sp. MSJ-14]
MEFKERLGKEILFFDGAMGTMLQERGLQTGEIPELWNVTHEDIILDVHKLYLEAGCDIVKANTFGINPFKMEGTGYTCEELTKKGIALVKRAIAETGKKAYTALDIGSLGKLLEPLGELPFEEAYEAFKPVCIAGEQAGADLVLIETMNDTYEIKAAVLAAKENTNLPIVVTMVFDESGKLLTGADMEAAVAMLEGLRVDAIGLNCGFGPDVMKEFLPKLREVCSVPIVVNPNAGLPVVVDGKTCFHVGPEEFASIMTEIAEEGISVMGGCCGTTPAHIKALVESCKGKKPLELFDKGRSVVSSYTHAVVLNERPKIIGERINPTGKSRLKQALRENDLEYIYKEALAQQDMGAHILDVNVGLPEIDEVEMMKSVLTGLQGITDLPLQIDTSDMVAMEQGMRLYNGKPLINSVNGKKESMDAVFPLVAKYGGMVVCLTLDENGIPETAEGRIEIAKRIIAEAERYGIHKKDLLMDTLCMTISTGQENAKITLDALDYVRNTLGVHTTLGVSNVSFGLPQRELVNTAFYTIALSRGLSAGIINPNSEKMMAAYHAYCALNASDVQCADYINIYSQQADAPKKTSDKKEVTLYDAVVRGLIDSAYQAAKKELETREPLAVIDEDLIPALDKVGQGFEKKTVFLPQLLMSADAAKAGFDAIKEFLQAKGDASESKGTIVIATVKGDIHDIGKNIVKVLLENYGFDVIDLGKDVPPETVVETAKEHNVKLVGLSALMTTTVVNMETTIKMLKEELPDCKVMVGGAVLTQTYADMIGADFYSKDAMGSVRYANELFGV